MATSSDLDLNRTVMLCEMCGVRMAGIVPYQAHVNGKQHKRAAELAKVRAVILTKTTTITVPGNDYYCKVCNKSMTGPEPYKQHIESAKHLKAAQNSGSPQIISVTQKKIVLMDTSDAIDASDDAFYINKHLKDVTIVEPRETIAGALSRMGYI